VACVIDAPSDRGRAHVRPRSRLFLTAERLVYNPINYRLVLVVDAVGASLFLLIGVWAPGSSIARSLEAAVGFIAWGLLEYAIHRWIGHGPRSIARRGHAYHHSDDTALVAAPVFVVLIGAFGVWAVLSLAIPIGVASLFVFGLYLGYNHYALVHHVLHHHETFAGHIGLHRLDRIHRVHHAQPTVNFGVTSTLWDRVFGTYQTPSNSPPRHSAPRPKRLRYRFRSTFSRTTRSYLTSSSHNPSATSCE